MSSCKSTFTVNELTTRFQQLHPKVIVCVLENLSKIQEAAADSQSVEKIIVVGNIACSGDSLRVVSYQSFLEKSFSILDAIPTEPQDVALLLFSSGTTGLPKGIPLTHYNVICNVLQTSPQDYYSSGYSESDSVALLLPSYHIGGFMLFFVFLYAGLKILTQPNFDFATKKAFKNGWMNTGDIGKLSIS